MKGRQPVLNRVRRLFCLCFWLWLMLYFLSKAGGGDLTYNITSPNCDTAIKSKVEQCYLRNLQFRKAVPHDEIFKPVAHYGNSKEPDYFSGSYYLKTCKKIIDFKYYPATTGHTPRKPFLLLTSIKDSLHVDKIVAWNEPQDFRPTDVYQAANEFKKEMLGGEYSQISYVEDKANLYVLVIIYFLEYRMVLLGLILGLWTAIAILCRCRCRRAATQNEVDTHATNKATSLWKNGILKFLNNNPNLFPLMFLAWIILFVLSKMGGYEIHYVVSSPDSDTAIKSKVEQCYLRNLQFRKAVPHDEIFKPETYYGNYHCYSAKYYLRNCKKLISFRYYPRGSNIDGEALVTMQRVSNAKNSDRIVQWRDARHFTAFEICKALREFEKEMFNGSKALSYMQSSDNCISFMMMYFIEYKHLILALILGLWIAAAIYRHVAMRNLNL